MFKIALKHRPSFICIVPEKRKEITTEGGLNLKKNFNKLKKIIFKFKKAKIRTSLFINPSLKDIKISKLLEQHLLLFLTFPYISSNIESDKICLKLIN